MARANIELIEFEEYVSPLLPEIMNYELRIRGVQPAQSAKIKRMQLARELHEEHNGKEVSYYFHLSPTDDLRECAALSARFEASLTNNNCDRQTIEATYCNLVVLLRRVKRINCISAEQANLKRLLLTNMKNTMSRGRIIMKPNTPNDLIDLSSDDNDSQINSVINNSKTNANFADLETGLLEKMFANVALSTSYNRPQPAPRTSRHNVNTFTYTNSEMNINNENMAHTNQQQQQNMYSYKLSHIPINHSRTNNENGHNNCGGVTQFNTNSRQMPSFSNFNQNIQFASTKPEIQINENNSHSFGDHKDIQSLHDTYIQNRFRHNAPYFGQVPQLPSSYNAYQQPTVQASFQNGSNQSSFSRRVDHKIYKWNVKFSGEEKNSNAIDFIQKVNALAQSRGVSNTDLFESSIEFFTGQALKWFYSQQKQLSSWTEISEKLVSDFVEVDYYDNLLMTIQQRKQKHDESVVHFVTIFEDDCSRLLTQLTSAEKINILKKNILQKYRSSIILREYGTVDELKHDLKLLESTMPNDRNVHFSRDNSRNRSYRNQWHNSTNSNKSPHRTYDGKSPHRSRYDGYMSSNSRSSSTQSNHPERNYNRNKNENFNHRSPTPGIKYPRDNA